MRTEGRADRLFQTRSFVAMLVTMAMRMHTSTPATIPEFRKANLATGSWSVSKSC